MSVEDQQPVSHWLSLLKAGDHVAAQPLWQHYFERLVRLVRARIPISSPLDHEGVAASAFESFWLAAAKGSFPQLNDRHDLWRILITKVAHKIADGLERANAQKRGGGTNRMDPIVLENVIGQEPSPEMVVMITEEFQQLLSRLTNDQYRQIAVWKMEGYTNEEISDRLGCALRTVTNRLDVIRKTFTTERPS
jgi:DNA-directed RNA polymerase specialized sigma24 family protein